VGSGGVAPLIFRPLFHQRHKNWCVLLNHWFKWSCFHTVTQLTNARLEVLKAVVIKSTILWDITPCSPLSVNLRFGGTYRFHFQGKKIIWTRNQRESMLQACHAGFLLSLFFRPWRWRRYIPPKRRLTLNGLHGAISQRMVLFNWLRFAKIPPSPHPQQFVEMER
jgi:hypothetical protein